MNNAADLVKLVQATALRKAGLGDVVGKVADVAMTPFDLEHKYIGKPLSKVATAPAKAVLPDKYVRPAESVLSQLLVPSTVIGPELLAGKLLKMGRVGQMALRSDEAMKMVRASRPTVYLSRDLAKGPERIALQATGSWWKRRANIPLNESGNYLAELYDVRRSLANPDKLPTTLYHVTTNLPGVQKTGRLLAGGARPEGNVSGGLGVGGSSALPHLSFTGDRQIAERLRDDLRTAVEGVQRFGIGPPPKDSDLDRMISNILNADLPEEEAFRQLRSVSDQHYAGMLEFLQTKAHEQGWAFRTSVANRSKSSFKNLLKNFFGERQRLTGRPDPIIFLSDDMLDLNPNDIELVAAHKDDVLKTGAALARYGDRHNKELRLYGDLPLSQEEWAKGFDRAFDEVLPEMSAGGVVGQVNLLQDYARYRLRRAGLGDIVGAAGDVASAVGGPIMDYMEWESKTIGEPLTSGLITPLKPILPKSVEKGIITIGGSLLTPSNALMMLIPVGRVATLARLSPQALLGSESARVSLRTMFASNSRQMASKWLASRTGRPVSEILSESSLAIVRGQYDSTFSPQIGAMRAAEDALKNLRGSGSALRLSLHRDKTIGTFKEWRDAIDLLGFTGSKEWVYNNFLNLPPSAFKDHSGVLARRLMDFGVTNNVDPGLRPIFPVASRVAATMQLEKEGIAGATKEYLAKAFGRKYDWNTVVKNVVFVGPAELADAPAVGTVWHVAQAPEMYKYVAGNGKQMSVFAPTSKAFTQEQKDALKFYSYVMERDRKIGVDLGVRIGQVPTGDLSDDAGVYMMHAFKDPTKAQRMFTAGDLTFAKAFRGRSHSTLGFVKRGQELGLEIETDITKLLDRRMTQLARKKSEQVFFQYLAKHPDPEVAALVEKKLVTFAGDKIVDILEPGLAGQGLRGNVRDTLEGALKQGARTPGAREAQYRTATEYRLRPAGDFAPGLRQHEMIRSIDDIMGPSLAPVDEKMIGKMVDYTRSAVLFADVSPLGLVQGVRAFSASPTAYFKALADGVAWRFNPQAQNLWTLHNLPRLRFWSMRGLTLDHPMDIDAGLFSKLKLGPIPAIGINQLGTFNEWMMRVVGTAKMEAADTMLQTVIAGRYSPSMLRLVSELPGVKQTIGRLGENWRTAPIEDVATAISHELNQSIGPLEWARYGKPPSALQKFFILTPSWTRGNIGLITDALTKGNLEGFFARWLFQNQLALAAKLSTGLSLSLTGQTPSYDPRDSRFLNVVAPWGAFSILPSQSVSRTIARLVAGQPEDLTPDLEARFQDLTNFVEGRMGLFPRTTIDMARGYDFMGRKQDRDVGFVARAFMPLIAQSAYEMTTGAERVGGNELIARLGLELMGSATKPNTPFMMERERVQQLTGKEPEEISLAEMRELRQSDPIMKELQKSKKNWRDERGDPLNNFFNLVEEDRAERDKQMTQFVIASPKGTPGREAQYAAIAEDLLSQSAELQRQAEKALGIDRENLPTARRETLEKDLAAIEFWAGPSGQRLRLALEQAKFEPDPRERDTMIDLAYRAFWDERSAVLAKTPQFRDYILKEWPRSRFANPEAKALEERRVRAQLEAREFFDTPRWRWPDGQPLTTEQEDRLVQIRDEFNQSWEKLNVRAIRAVVESTGLPYEAVALKVQLPSGSKQKLWKAFLTQSAQDGTDDETLRLIALATALDTKAEVFLRNPQRDQILLRNPDIIKFFPDSVKAFLRRDLVAAINDPEISRIANEQ